MPMPVTSETVDRLIATALTLAEERGWRALTITDIALAAEVSLADAHVLFPDKGALLSGILMNFEREVFAEGPTSPDDDSPRDRLFEILMRRFDAFQTHRGALLRIWKDMPFDPVSAIRVAPGFPRAMVWMLEAARIPATGIAGSLRVKALSVIFLNAFRTWLGDETGDLSQTMAALDRGLRQTESIARQIPFLTI